MRPCFSLGCSGGGRPEPASHEAPEEARTVPAANQPRDTAGHVHCVGLIAEAFIAEIETRAGTDVGRGRVRLAATIVAAHALKHLYISGFGSLVMPRIKIGLALSSAQFGSLATARSIANSFSTFSAGYLGDRFSGSAGPMLAFSLGLMGVSLALAGFAPNYWTMFAVMFLVGIGPAFFHPPAIGALSRRFPNRRGFAVSLHGMGANAGEVLGPATAAGVLALLMWRDVLRVSVIPALLAALAVWMLVRATPGERQAGVESFRAYLASVGGLLRNRVLIVLVVAVALKGVGEGAVTVFLPVYLIEELKYSSARAGLLLSIQKVAGLVSQPVMGLLSDRYGRKAVLAPAMATAAALAFALSLAEPGPQLVAVVVASGAFSFSLHHVFITAAIDSARGPLQSTVVALIYGASFVGAVSPYLAGLISDRFGIPGAFVYSGIVLSISAALIARSRIPRPQPPVPSP